jgi:hypothetical protein
MWLHRKAVAHVRRDRKRGRANARNNEYKLAIHIAVGESNGEDAYTGEPLDWKLIRQWDNSDAREQKKRFGLLPSLDHMPEEEMQPQFKICAWRTNDAKSDLPYKDFVALCERVVAFAKKRRGEG